MARKSATKAQEQNLQTPEVTESVSSETTPDIETTLKAIGLEIAKHKISQELRVHTLAWMDQILHSNDPKHAQIRAEIVNDLKAILAASVLSDCLRGAVADSQKLLVQSASFETAQQSE